MAVTSALWKLRSASGRLAEASKQREFAWRYSFNLLPTLAYACLQPHD